MSATLLNLAVLVLSIVVPALIALHVTPRWRLWSLAAWALSPLLIALLMASFEIASDRASAADLDKLVYGLLLIGSILALPWLLACAAGYGIGAAVRRRTRPTQKPEPKPEPQPQPQLQLQLQPVASATTLTPPDGLADAAAGTSADGSLRFAHDLGPLQNGRFDSVAPVARLVDSRTGAVLFEGVHWASSRVVPQVDRTLLLTLEHNARQTIFRIDPVTGAFIDLSVPGAARPITELTRAASTARAECDDPAIGRIGRRVAPDGSLQVDLQPTEWSNSHWVHSPRVVEVATGRVLLDLWGTDWDATVSFPRMRAVKLSLRRYHVGGALDAELTLADQQYRLQARAHTASGPLAELALALERVSQQQCADLGARLPSEAPRVTARSWMVALLIAAGAIALIAAATAITSRMQGEPTPQKLDVVPRMPGSVQALS